MPLVLEIIDGPGIGRRIVLTRGQVATVGRTEYADYSFGEIANMSSMHFCLSYDAQGCTVRDLDSLNGTILNGQRIQEATLQDGDQIVVGQSVFRVHVDAEDKSQGAPAQEPSLHATVPVVPPEVSGIEAPAQAADEVAEEEASSPLLDEQGFRDCSVPETCEQIADLGDDAKALIRDDLTPPEFAAELVEKELLEDAVRFVAYALCKRDAVQWGCACVREGLGELGEDDAAALDIAETWVKEPNDGNRRQAQAAAEKLEHATPASWVAMGAFFSEGSVAPPDTPAVPPAPHLTGHCVAGAVMLAAVDKEPENASEKFRQFVTAGVNVE
jgi:pSer/pThr/pTyr-binding forkhead associated (FHA) protein